MAWKKESHVFSSLNGTIKDAISRLKNTLYDLQELQESNTYRTVTYPGSEDFLENIRKADHQRQVLQTLMENYYSQIVNTTRTAMDVVGSKWEKLPHSCKTQICELMQVLTQVRSVASRLVSPQQRVSLLTLTDNLMQEIQQITGHEFRIPREGVEGTKTPGRRRIGYGREER